MLKKLIMRLTLFGEGGDGGDGGASASAEGVGGESGAEMARIPERARKNYLKAMQKTAPNPKVEETTNNTAESRTSYADLIKSDEYKDEHKAYMEKTINDRLRKYKHIEESHTKAMDALGMVAQKYGVDVNEENFLEVLQGKIDEDDSYYEQYAMDHDMTAQEARRVVTMERKVARMEAEEANRAKQEQMRQQIAVLHQNAERTKAQFPDFDLDVEMQDEKFRRLCAVNNGDTTAAYMACHWNEILPATVQVASKRIQAQTAESIKANQSRPRENGMSSSAASAVVSQDFSNMSLAELRAYADKQRRLGRKK